MAKAGESKWDRNQMKLETDTSESGCNQMQSWHNCVAFRAEEDLTKKIERLSPFCPTFIWPVDFSCLLFTSIYSWGDAWVASVWVCKPYMKKGVLLVLLLYMKTTVSGSGSDWTVVFNWLFVQRSLFFLCTQMLKIATILSALAAVTMLRR